MSKNAWKNLHAISQPKGSRVRERQAEEVSPGLGASVSQNVGSVVTMQLG